MPGDGNVHAFMPHDGHAFAHVIAAVHAHGGLRSFGEGFFLHDVQLARGVVELGLHIREPVDAGDDVGGRPCRGRSGRRGGPACGRGWRTWRCRWRLRRRQRIRGRQEAEAFRFVAQEHGGQVAVAQAHLAVVGHGAGNAEGLEPFADGFSGVGGLRAALLDGDGGAHHIGPAGVFKGDRLDSVDDFTDVDALGKAELFRFFNGTDAVLGQGFVDLLDAAVVGFERGIMVIVLEVDILFLIQSHS